MVALKFVPVKSPVVKGEFLYDTLVSTDRSHYESLGLKIRAKTAARAEQKLLFCFRRELKDKTLDFNPEAFKP